MGTCAKESVALYFIEKHRETNKTITIHLNYIIYRRLEKNCMRVISQYFQPIGSLAEERWRKGPNYTEDTMTCVMKLCFKPREKLIVQGEPSSACKAIRHSFPSIRCDDDECEI